MANALDLEKRSKSSTSVRESLF